MVVPDYRGGGIVNLMTTLALACGGDSGAYPPLEALPAEGLARARNLLLLVIDGLGYEYLAQRWPASTLARNMAARITSVFPSTTASAITTTMTGAAPQQHALTGWHMYFRELDAVAVVVQFRTRSDGRSLAALGAQPAALFDHTPFFDRIALPAHVVSPQRIIDSEFNVAHCGGARRHGYNTLAQFFEAIAALIADGEGRKFIYAYFPELDTLAHRHGAASPQVADEFHAFDRAFARFLERARGTGTAIIATADHGLIDSPRERLIELDDHPALAETLALPLCGERRVAYCYVHRHQRAQFEAYVAERLGHCAMLTRSDSLIAQGYFGLGEPHPRLAERIGDYALVMKDDYTIKDWLPQEKRHAQIGVHGGMSAEEMYVPLIVMHV